MENLHLKIFSDFEALNENEQKTLLKAIIISYLHDYKDEKINMSVKATLEPFIHFLTAKSELLLSYKEAFTKWVNDDFKELTNGETFEKV